MTIYQLITGLCSILTVNSVNVGFSYIYISQGSVATPLRCGVIIQ